MLPGQIALHTMLRLRFLHLLLGLSCYAFSVTAQNDKQVIGDPVLSPQEILDGTSIIYLIRFQNVGDDTVQQVVVRDTLDPRLDLETFVTISASAEFQLLGEGGNYIRWYFEDIQLPDSASGGNNSIGYVLFSINPRPFLVPGQSILNHACISFDQSSVICTNDAVVLIDAEADTNEPDQKPQALQVVPNPNYGQFEVRPVEQQEISDGSNAQWWITDMNGKTIWNGAADNASAASHMVMLERPSPGLYLLWIKSKQGVQVERFTVIH